MNTRESILQINAHIAGPVKGDTTMKIRKSTAMVITALALLTTGVPFSASAASPRLVLQITVDQLRGDLPGRYADRLSEGGFRYLMEKGTWYRDAHYRHANTETAVGHATLATGADPSRHGIVANDWIDQETGAFVYNTEDDRHHIIGQKPRPHEGVSPHNLLASTISDELVVHSGGRSRAFSVSVKPRRQGLLVFQKQRRVRHEHLLLR
jgi:hypothetical protein